MLNGMGMNTWEQCELKLQKQLSAPGQTVRRLFPLWEKQARFLDATEPIKGFVAGIGSGKTKIGAYDLLRRAKPGRLSIVTGPTYKVLSDSTIRTFEEVARYCGQLIAILRGDMKAHIRTSDGGQAEILFRSTDNPDNLRGPNASHVWMDEASLSPYEAFQILIGRLREAGEMGTLSATFTPKGLTHWTYDVFGHDPPPPGVFLIHAKTDENPFLPLQFVEQAKQYHVGLRGEQELGGRFVSVEGAEWPAEYFPDSIWFHDWPYEPIICRALALDPAQGKGERDKGCYAAFVLAGLDRHGVVWLECWASRDWDAKQLAERMAVLNREHKPNGVSTEMNGGQGFLKDNLFAAANAINVPLPLHGFNNTVDKEVRIRGLGPLLAQSRIRVRDTPGGRLLVMQMRDFPMGEYVDCCDAAEMACRLLVHLNRKGKAPSPHGPVLVR